MTKDECDARVRYSLTRSLSPDPLSHSRPCVLLVTPSHALPKRAARTPLKCHSCKGIALQSSTARD